MDTRTAPRRYILNSLKWTPRAQRNDPRTDRESRLPHTKQKEENKFVVTHTFLYHRNKGGNLLNGREPVKDPVVQSHCDSHLDNVRKPLAYQTFTIDVCN